MLKDVIKRRVHFIYGLKIKHKDLKVKAIGKLKYGEFFFKKLTESPPTKEHDDCRLLSSPPWMQEAIQTIIWDVVGQHFFLNANVRKDQ